MAEIRCMLHRKATPTVKPSVLPQRDSHFSWLRTRMSTERTLMSWTRTATALIGFGFTLAQFFENFSRMPGVTPPRHPGMVRTVALSMIAIGTIALWLALGEYRAMIHYLWSEDFHDIAGVAESPRATPASSVAVLLVLVGVLTFVAVVVRSAGR